jgi:hypothetical protein
MKKLIPLIDYVLQIDWMTTVEFCETYQIPKPRLSGDVDYSVSEIFRIDAIKQKMFVDYAKFLNKDITVEILKIIGFNQDNFKGILMPDYTNGKYEITNDKYGFYLQPYDSVGGRRITKVSQLCDLGLTINNL